MRKKGKRHSPRPQPVKPLRHSNRITLALAISILFTLGVLLILASCGVALGQSGTPIYRYSAVMPIRLLRCWPLLPIIAMLALALRLIADPQRTRRTPGLLVGFIVTLSLCAWTWWLPTAPATQQALNMLSPAQDGAFLAEAMHIDSTDAYLKSFNEHIQLPLNQQFGTRVISNPPGTTLIARWMLNTFPSRPSDPGMFERLSEEVGPDVPLAPIATAWKFSILLTLLWALSIVPAYLLGREFLSPLGAAAVALLITFNPATFNFSPGKDTTQLLTINAMLWTWFAGARRRSLTWTTMSGAILGIGLTIGLVHFWIALAALLATCLQNRGIRRVVPQVVAAIIGTFVIVVFAWLIFGWNMPATLLATARKYTELQPQLAYDRTQWFFIGLPLFLLFVSPAVFALAALRRKIVRRGSAGFSMLCATLLIMAVVYVVGVDYELPRLWVAFIPLLTLAVSADQPLFKGASTQRVVRPVMAIVIAGILAAAIHFCAMDARESEYRTLNDHRMLN